jgi:hypothetical protein
VDLGRSTSLTSSVQRPATSSISGMRSQLERNHIFGENSVGRDRLSHHRTLGSLTQDGLSGKSTTQQVVDSKELRT